MPSPAFDASLPFVLRWEGGYVDHPNDPGGKTNQGITQKAYDRWRARRGLPARSVRDLETDELRAIYESDYWLATRCDLLERQLDLVHFDAAVNMGPKRAVRYLQMALGCTADGDFGPKTQEAVATCDAGTATIAYCQARENYYRNLADANPKLRVFLKGWLNRLNALRREVGLPGFESARGVEPETEITERIPDLGEDPDYDL